MGMRLIIVTGLFSSGTSAVAAMLHAMGVPMGFEMGMVRPPTRHFDYEDLSLGRMSARQYLGVRMDRERRYAEISGLPMPRTIGFKSVGLLRDPDWPEVCREQGFDPRVVMTRPRAHDSIDRDYGVSAPRVRKLNEELRGWIARWDPDLTIGLDDIREDPAEAVNALSVLVEGPIDAAAGAKAIRKECVPWQRS